MGWVIRKATLTKYGFYDDAVCKVTLTKDRESRDGWIVTFHDADTFNCTAQNIDRAVGYVRGVERAVEVYGAEVREGVR